VDLFASRVNKKCRIFYARFSDPEAEIIDAFTVDWGGEHFYAFPPFRTNSSNTKENYQ